MLVLRQPPSPQPSPQPTFGPYLLTKTDQSSDTEITEWTDGLVNPGEHEGNLVSEIMRYKPWNEGAASVGERHDGPPGEVSGSGS